MKALVIYDSQFGNTAKVAHAIGEALRANGDVAVLRVSEACPLTAFGASSERSERVRPEHWADVGLLLVGSPTQRFRPLPTVTQLLAGLPARGLAGVKVAAFDTRVPDEVVNSGVYSFFVRFMGYAAKPIADALVKKGGELVAPPEGFIVVGMEGPLKEGEIERAERWARGVGERVMGDAGA